MLRIAARLVAAGASCDPCVAGSRMSNCFGGSRAYRHTCGERLGKCSSAIHPRTGRNLRPPALALLIAVVVTSSGFCGDAIFLQAEAFTCNDDSWVVREQVGPYAPDSGLRHLWGATGGQGTAWMDVQVPQPGPYVIWVRHTVMRGDGRGPFQVSLKQEGKVLAAGTFDDTPPIQAPRYIHRYDFSRFEADLPAGPVRVEITKLPPVGCSGWTRYVDCLVLTTDADYVPRATDFQPRIWLRVTLGQSVENPVYIHCFSDHYRPPWYKHFNLSKDGYEERVVPRRGQAAFLRAGESTPWCDITPAIHEDRGARLELRLAEKYSYTEWLPNCDAVFEFATAPDDAAIVKRFERKGPGAGLAVVTPGTLSAATVAALRRDRDYLEDSRKLAATLPEVPWGKRPERFPLNLTISLRRQLFDPQIREGELRIVAKLGFNGLPERLDAAAEALGFRFSRTGTQSWYMRDECYLQPQRDKIEAKVASVAMAWETTAPTVVMFMDEPTAKPLAHAAACATCTERFVRWLRDELDVPLADLGRGSWEDIRPVTIRPVTEEARDSAAALYYYSQRFRGSALGEFLRLQTDEIGNAFAGAPPATVNFSDGAVYRANMYVQGVDYFHLFGSGALTMAWSEDWSNLASTYQCCGYNVDLLRAACKVHNQPLGMYLIAAAGRTPLDVKLKAYSSIGRGVRMLQSYAYGIPYASHHNGWYMNRDIYLAIMQLTHEIGAAEDLLLQATRLPSEVAFLYSTTSDIWTLGDNELHGHERMHCYIALTHAQVPVDFLSEDDVSAGRLNGYKALYVFGPNLSRKAAAPIAEWTQAGGTLYLAAGAAIADEYNVAAKPLDTALRLHRGDLETLQTHTGPGRYLRGLTPHGRVTLAHDAADILGLRQPLDAKATPEASVLGRAEDGIPLAIRCRRGNGVVFSVGFMPGISYIRKALLARDAEEAQPSTPGDDLGIPGMDSATKLPPHERSYNPAAYPDAEREFLLLPVRRAGVVRPVTLNQPLVEAFYLEGPKGAVVTLANYALRPIEKLRVSIRPPREVSGVESVRNGALDAEVTGQVISVQLPLIDTDMLKLRW